MYNPPIELKQAIYREGIAVIAVKMRDRFATSLVYEDTFTTSRF